VPPYDPGAVAFALDKALHIAQRDRCDVATGTVITVFSPKGGTGKSAVASNLATSLARRRRRRTLLVDLDLQFGDAAIMLGSVPSRTISELARGSEPVDAERLDVYVETHTSSLDILAAPLQPEEAELIDGEAIRSVLELAKSVYDVVLIDTAPFFDQHALASIDVTDHLLLVCTPDIPTVKNVRLALSTLDMLSFPDEKLRVVLNRSGEAGCLSVDEVARGLGRAVDVVLPFDVAVPHGINRGVPAVLASERAPFVKALTALGRELAGHGEATASPSVSRTGHSRFFTLAWR
jgi:pilus assembly protein CpaE